VKGIAGEIANSSTAAPAKQEGLEELVDRTEAGYLFRKDLPFPQKIRAEVRTTSRIRQRGVTESLFGKTAVVLDGTISNRAGGERNGNEAVEQTYIFAYNPAKKEEAVAEKKGAFSFLSEETGKAETKLEPKPAAKLPFRLTKGGWVLAGDELTAAKATVTSRMAPHQELAALGLVERRYWFGANRLKIGDEVTVSGDHLEMVDGMKGAGTLVIKLQGMEKIDGHPCGLFSMSGNYTTGIATGQDDATEAKMSLTSGKIWMSLLYPLVLKQEMEGITSERQGQRGGVGAHTQGTVEISTECEWMPADPLSR
jgi:hypothetical protein